MASGDRLHGYGLEKNGEGGEGGESGERPARGGGFGQREGTRVFANPLATPAALRLVAEGADPDTFPDGALDVGYQDPVSQLRDIIEAEVEILQKKYSVQENIQNIIKADLTDRLSAILIDLQLIADWPVIASWLLILAEHDHQSVPPNIKKLFLLLGIANSDGPIFTPYRKEIKRIIDPKTFRLDFDAKLP